MQGKVENNNHYHNNAKCRKSRRNFGGSIYRRSACSIPCGGRTGVAVRVLARCNRPHACMTVLTSRRAIVRPSKAALGFRAVGKMSVVRAGTRKLALRATEKFVGTTYCDVLSPPESPTRPTKRHNRAAMRGQTRKANFGYVLQHSWHRRAASPWPTCEPSLE